MKYQYQPYYYNSWALIIGINDYQHVSPLGYACNDADAIERVVCNGLGFASENITVLKDKDATKNAILDAFHGYINKANHPDDRLLVFFAGHGLTRPGSKGHVGFLVPFDGNPKNTNTLVRWDELTRNAELIIAKHILFVMDACYSGLAMQRAISPGAQRFVSNMLQRSARQVITAGKADEVVADGGGPTGQNSIFTGHLLEGLQGAANDEIGVLTANALMHYVYKHVGQDARSSQTPHYGHIDGDGDFILHTPNQEHLLQKPIGDFLVQPIIEHPEVQLEAITETKPTFASRIGYVDPAHPNFGRNNWSGKLGEYRLSESYERDISRAYSWISLIAEPTSIQQTTISIGNDVFPRSTSDKPFERLRRPYHVMTTSDSRFYYDLLEPKTNYWARYLRIDKNGNIEYASSGSELFYHYKDVRSFNYVNIIGIVWQFMFLAKRLLEENNYRFGVNLIVSLVGTKDTILDNFSQELGEHNHKWQDPHDLSVSWRSNHPTQCSDENIQNKYQLILSSLDESSSGKIITNLAEQLSLAYNHQSMPRCFNYNTLIFPWNQYLRSQSF